MPHSEMNPPKASGGPIPTAVRMPDAPLNVLVIGGDGPLGSALVRGLQNPNYAPAFRVFVLEGAAMRGLTKDNVGVQLTPRLKGMHTVIMADYRPMNEVTAADNDETDSAVMTACKDAEVKRFLPSPFGIDVRGAKKLAGTFDSIQHAVEQQKSLTLSGVDYIVISCGVLTEHLFSPLAGVDVSRGVVNAPGGANTTVTTTTLEDLSRLLPEVLLSPASKDKHVDLCSATITYADIARVIERVTGRPATLVEVNSKDVRQRAKDNGSDPAAVLGYLIESGKGLFWSKGDSWNAKHVPHVVTTPVDVWAQQHLVGGAQGGARGWEPNLHPAAFSAPEGSAVTRPDKLGAVFTGEQVPVTAAGMIPPQGTVPAQGMVVQRPVNDRIVIQ